LRRELWCCFKPSLFAQAAIHAKKKMQRKPQMHIQEKVNLVKLERTLNREQQRGAKLNDQINKLLKHLLKKKVQPPKPKVKVFRSQRPWAEDPLTK